MLGHPHGWPLGAVGCGEHHLGGEPVVTLAEHRRAHREGLADSRLGRLPTEVDHGHDVHDGDASDHFSNLARSRREGAIAAPSRQVGGTRPDGRMGDGWARPHVAPTRVSPQREVPGCVMRRSDVRRLVRERSGPSHARAWNDPRTRANVCGCAPSDDSPSAPCSPRPLSALGDLANNLRWSWHPPTQDVFASVDPDAVGVDRPRPGPAARRGRRRRASTSSPPTASSASGSARSSADLAAYLSEDRWYQRRVQDGPRAIGYFSPEFGITAVLPQYSGGLGILAGDHLKAASDLGVPIVGVGLLYRHGYFKQSLSSEGWQQESYPVLDPDELPISLLREPDGTRATISIDLPDGPPLVARIWVVAGRPGPAAAAGHRRRGQPPALRRRDRPALRRQQRAPAAPGAAARRRRRPRAARVQPDHRPPDARGVPHQRGPRRLPRHRADPRAHRGGGRPGGRLGHRARDGPRVHGLHHAHPRAGRHRPVPARRWSSSTSARTARRPACRSRSCSPSAPRTTPAATRRCSTWP